MFDKIRDMISRAQVDAGKTDDTRFEEEAARIRKSWQKETPESVMPEDNTAQGLAGLGGLAAYGNHPRTATSFGQAVQQHNLQQAIATAKLNAQIQQATLQSQMHQVALQQNQYNNPYLNQGLSATSSMQQLYGQGHVVMIGAGGTGGGLSGGGGSSVGNAGVLGGSGGAGYATLSTGLFHHDLRPPVFDPQWRQQYERARAAESEKRFLEIT